MQARLTARYDRMGMLWFLKGERVVALTATKGMTQCKPD
jgi:hypothetical protein